MKKTKLSKVFTEDQAAERICKAVYKSMVKSLKDKKTKENTQEIVEDVLDPNFVAEVDPDEIPSEKEKVMWKKDGKSAKSKSKKGIDKLKKFVTQKTCKDEPIPGLSQK
jgi:hypothetical protein